MDIEQLEALALADDRAGALAALIPGTDDHDYYRCLALQQAGALEEAERILDGWPQRHGYGERFDRLKRRQLLHRLERDPQRVLHEVRDQTGAILSHEPEAAAAAVRHPSRLDPDAIARAALIGRAIDGSPDLSQLTDDALPDLLDRELEPTRRRTLLGRLGATSHPRLLAQLAADLAAKGSRGFGSLGVHAQLTLEQLHALAGLRAELRREPSWVDAVITRMRPASPDWRARPALAEAYLHALEQLVVALAPSYNSLKAHVLYHRLDADRRRGVYDRARFLAYLALPRNAAHVPRDRLRDLDGSELVQLGRAFPATDLPPVPDDDPLVRDVLHHLLAAEDRTAFAELLDADWLETEEAIARLLAGDTDDRWAQKLGPSRLAHLRDRVDLDLAPQNRERWRATDRVVLEVDVKHVATLTVKVFRINVQAWFAAHGTDVDATVDLDGLTARTELAFAFDEPPLRRHRRRLELDACDRPGVYVVELIGNGKSSRAVIRKGDLRPVVRVGVAGPVVMIVDERGQLVLDAVLWLGGREHRPRADGGITLPFSTRPGRVPVLLCHGELAVRALIDHAAETYGFDVKLHLEREALVAGQPARALVRAALTVAGRPATLALVTAARVEISITDVAGTTTTRDQPIDLADDDAGVIEWPVPEHTASIAVTVRGKVRVVSEQRELDVSGGAHVDVAAIQSTEHTEAMFLARTTGGHVLYLLGRTGEPRPRRAIALAVRHRAVTWDVHVTLETDDRGRIELGALDGVVAVRATAPSGVTGDWPLDPPPPTIPVNVHVVAGNPAVVPLPIAARSPTLVELRGGAPLRDVSAAVTREDHAAVARDLAPGVYQLTAIGLGAAVRIVVADSDASEVGGWIDDGIDALERAATPTRIRHAALDGDALVIHVAEATAATRVHVIATRFQPSRATAGLAAPPPALGWTRRLPPESHYLSGRDLGDEYRYVLERRGAPRRPGTSLDRPGLLLNPWALRSTSTSVAVAGMGGAYGAPAPRPQSAAGGGGAAYAKSIADGDAFAGHDFLPHAAIVLANLRPDGSGHLRIARADLGDAGCARVVCIGPALTTFADVALDEAPLAPRDLRLRLALPADGHFMEAKQVTPLAAGGTFEAADLATARVQVVDTVAKIHAYLLALGNDATLREFAFVTRWPALDAAEQRTLYSKYACHELHLFLAFKDPGFFAQVARPHLAHKRQKTFVDRWLLGDDLAPYLEPWAFGRLNAVERALLARRLPAETAAVARVLADAVDLVAPDPEGDARGIDTLIAGGALDADNPLGRAAADAKADAFEASDMLMAKSEVTRGAPAKQKRMMHAAAAAGSRGPSAPPAPAAGFAAPMAEESMLALDLAEREVVAPMFRGADKTQEWAENDWWHRRIDEMTADLVTPDRFWRDLAAHGGAVERGFLSPHVGDCAGSFAEAMSALAVLDLPFLAGAHDLRVDDRRLRLTAASPCLVAWSQIVPVTPAADASAILVGQRYFRGDDRWEWDGAEQREKPVTGELIAGVVYVCRVVVSNPTGSRERLAVLVQVPRGSIAVGGALPTRTVHVDLDPYGTWSYEYAFYVPAPGVWSCFPVHVTRLGALVACAAPAELTVVAEPTDADAASWAHVSQHGSLDEVAAFLTRANLGRIELERIAWRLKERAAFERITALLAARHHYADVVWAYALAHRDRTRLAEWLRHQDDFVRVAGPQGGGGAVELDPVTRGWYQHLEYAPLTNARAHRLGARTRILNAALDGQYRAFLETVAHRSRPTADDLLAAAHYLFTMDRVDDAAAALARVARADVGEQLQYDYLVAYAAVCRGDVVAARAAARPWVEYPVDRWRRKFVALIALLDDAAGAAAGREADPDSRQQRMDALAADEPAIDVAVDGADLVIDHHHLDRCHVRLYPMDIELLFSRQPFVGADTGRFAFIEPAWSHEVMLPRDGATRLPVPDALRSANLVVEVVAGGLRKTAARFAHDLTVQVATSYGQVRVVRASTRAALPAAYVKVYARSGGVVAFYKDGYTDVAGRFDYATLSTDDLDRVERFAILVVADDAGAVVTEAAPPPR